MKWTEDLISYCKVYYLLVLYTDSCKIRTKKDPAEEKVIRVFFGFKWN